MYSDWEPARASANSSSSNNKQASPPPSTISVWRSILVANEWAELQVSHGTIYIHLSIHSISNLIQMHDQCKPYVCCFHKHTVRACIHT